ncbi:MAG: hypothetical protein PHN84_11715 [Desulfuromonadaceae bacterium]|nr:hypothetical protein [Desulfuromonadaceae bacterium]MDD2855707.1 hypothetical protein [Desulfuromonadaceae bacterium]
MQTATDTVENRGNMILKMMRNFNAGTVRVIMGIRFRSVGATVLGSLAGLSLTTNVLPSSLSMMGFMDNFSARWGLGGFAVYSMMLWGVGGWAVQKTGDKKLGGIVLGLLGLISGILFTAIGISTEMDILLTGGVAAMLYGAVGGMIIGDALRDPPADPNNPKASIGRIGDMGIFGYFKDND